MKLSIKPIQNRNTLTSFSKLAQNLTKDVPTLAISIGTSLVAKSTFQDWLNMLILMVLEDIDAMCEKLPSTLRQQLSLTKLCSISGMVVREQRWFMMPFKLPI